VVTTLPDWSCCSATRVIFTEQGKDEIPSADLVRGLVGLDGRPWAELGKSRKPLTTNGLARRLKPLAIIPENIRVGDKVPKGYKLAHFEEAFSRYLPPEGASEPLRRYSADEMGTSEPSQTATAEPDAAVRKCEKSANDGPRSGVGDEKGENGQNAREGTFEILGRAPSGSRCYFCSKGGEVHLVRRQGDREVDQAHLGCAEQAWSNSQSPRHCRALARQRW
jgi:hypothetical protein